MARPRTSPSLHRSRRILARIFGPPELRRFAVRYWNGRVDRPSGEPAFTLVLTWPGALRRMLLPPTERSMGAVYVRGDCDVEGDLEAAVRAVRAALEDARPPSGLARLARDLLALPTRTPGPDDAEVESRGPPFRSGRRHSRDRDARSVR